jgi:hypothetical protein
MTLSPLRDWWEKNELLFPSLGWDNLPFLRLWWGYSSIKVPYLEGSGWWGKAFISFLLLYSRVLFPSPFGRVSKDPQTRETEQCG